MAQHCSGGQGEENVRQGEENVRQGEIGRD